MKKNADATWIAYQAKRKDAMDIEGTQNRHQNYQANRDSLSIAKGKNPTTIIFQEAKENYDRENPKLLQLEKDRNDKHNAMEQAWSSVPKEYDTLTHKSVPVRGSEYNNYEEKQRAYTSASSDYIKKEKEVNKYADTMKKERIKYEQELNEKIQRQDTIIDKLTTKIEEDNAIIEKKTKEKEDF